jgi:N-acetylmuramoyl-L-alanine amidase
MKPKLISLGILLSVIFSSEILPAEIEPKLPWDRLKKYHDTLTLNEFRNLVDRIYSPDGSLYEYLDVTPEYIDIYNDKKKSKPSLFRLFLAKSDESKKPIRAHFKNRRDLNQPRSSSKPLEGLRILLDPGHIGGEYAVMEQRIFRVKDRPSVTEADLNLKTAQLLKSKLKKLGATVYLTKENFKPVTKTKPEDFRKEAQKNLSDGKTTPAQNLIQKEMERLFYRTSEIEARAELVNRIKPDLTLCIHFNATPGSKDTPWTQDNRLVFFIHGCYEAVEIDLEEQRFKLFSKLLEGSHETELALTLKIAKAMASQTGLPPVEYPPSPHYIKVGNNPYVYARNLSANRLFVGPVIYLEPYYQNNRLVYERFLAGDYKGEKIIQGKSYRSIFEEYADSVTNGILNYFES